MPTRSPPRSAHLAARMPTYITLKEVKKRWGHGQEDVFPVAQFEKLWGDMTALPEIDFPLRGRAAAARAATQRSGATGRLAARWFRPASRVPLRVVAGQSALIDQAFKSQPTQVRAD